MVDWYTLRTTKEGLNPKTAKELHRKFWVGFQASQAFRMLARVVGLADGKPTARPDELSNARIKGLECRPSGVGFRVSRYHKLLGPLMKSAEPKSQAESPKALDPAPKAFSPESVNSRSESLTLKHVDRPRQFSRGTGTQTIPVHRPHTQVPCPYARSPLKTRKPRTLRSESLLGVSQDVPFIPHGLAHNPITASPS